MMRIYASCLLSQAPPGPDVSRPNTVIRLAGGRRGLRWCRPCIHRAASEGKGKAAARLVDQFSPQAFVSLCVPGRRTYAYSFLCATARATCSSTVAGRIGGKNQWSHRGGVTILRAYAPCHAHGMSLVYAAEWKGEGTCRASLSEGCG